MARINIRLLSLDPPLHLLLQLVLPSMFFELLRINKRLTGCLQLLLLNLRLLPLLFPLKLYLLLFLLDLLDHLRCLLLLLCFGEDSDLLGLLLDRLFGSHHYFALILPKEICIAPRGAASGGIIIEQGRIIGLRWLRLL